MLAWQLQGYQKSFNMQRESSKAENRRTDNNLQNTTCKTNKIGQHEHYINNMYVDYVLHCNQLNIRSSITGDSVHVRRD